MAKSNNGRTESFEKTLFKAADPASPKASDFASSFAKAMEDKKATPDKSPRQAGSIEKIKGNSSKILVLLRN